MKEIKLVVFDFDQTIVNSIKGFDKAFKKVMEEFKRFLKKHNYTLKLENYFPALKKKMRELDIQRIYNRNLWWNSLLKELEITEIEFTEKECNYLTERYWNITAKYTELFPDTLDVFDYLKRKNYKFGLLSDTDGAPGLKRTRLQKSGLTKYFNSIMISGDDVSQTKPDPYPYLKLAADLEVSPKNSVMVGDKPFTDIKGGKAAGFFTILVLRESWEIDPVPDFQIHELKELKSIL